MTSHGDEGRRADAVAAWASSGAMSLTGPPDGRGLGPPDGLVSRVQRAGEHLRAQTARLGIEVAIDPLALLGERAALSGLHRGGTISCGGGTRMLATADGWLALSLPRASDVELLSPWFGRRLDRNVDHWEVAAAELRRRSTSAAVATGAELGLPVGGLPSGASGVAAPTSPGVRRVQINGDDRGTTLERLLVVDLSSLWAGPLCGSLLGLAGAETWKVESTQRPDGARLGPTDFFDLLNSGKRSVAIDFSSDEGRRRLLAVIEHADVVIEASRPRALEQLGIDARRILARARPRVWISITAHGRGQHGRQRTGFGDDTAVAGGVVAWHDAVPNFCADAVADPVTGLTAAAACLDALVTGGSWLLDVSMAAVAAEFAGPTLPVPAGVVADAPTARPQRGRGPVLGADTESVLATIGTRA